MINHQHFKNYWIKVTLTIHHRSIGALVTEIYKVLQGYSLAIVNEVFVTSHCKYNFCKNNSLERRRVNKVR